MWSMIGSVEGNWNGRLGFLNLANITLSCFWCVAKGMVDGYPSDMNCAVYFLRVVGINLLLGMLFAMWIRGGMRGFKEDVMAVKT